MRLLTPLFLALLLCSTTFGAKRLSLPEVKDHIAQLEANSAAPADIQAWNDVKNSIEANTQIDQAITTAQAEIQQAPESLQQLQKKIQELTGTTTVKPDESLEISELEATLNALRAKSKAHAEQDDALKQEEQTRNARTSQLPVEIANLQIQYDNSSAPAAPEANAPALETAQYQLALNKRQNLQKKLKQLQLESQLYKATDKLFDAKKQLNQLEITRLNEQISIWQSAYDQKFSELTKLSQERAEDQLKRFANIPALAEITQENADLADLRAKLATQTATAKVFKQTIAQQYSQVIEHKNNALERIKLLESSGLNIDTKTGELLRKQRASLPTPALLKQRLEEHLIESTNAQFTLLELKNQQRQSKLSNDDARADEILSQLEPNSIDKESIVNLLASNRQLRDGAIEDHNNHIALLKSLNESTKRTLKEIDSYSLFLDERLLWIPSAKRLHFTDVLDEHSAFTKLFSPESLLLGWNNLKKDFSEHTALWLCFITLSALALSLRNKSIRGLKAMTQTASHRHSTSILPSLKALGFTLLLTQILPAILAFVAHRLQSPTGIAQGLLTAALIISIMSFLKKSSNKYGLLHHHLKIEQSQTHHLHVHSTWYLYAAPALFFFTTALPLSDNSEPNAGRLSFLTLMLVTAIFTHLLLRPGKLELDGSTPTWRHKSLYIAALATPLIFALGSALGYISSVHTLATQTLFTLVVIGAALLLARFCSRWILVSRRHLARNQARQKYKAILAAEKNESDESGPSLEEIEAHAVNVVALEEQTRRLVKIATAILIFTATWNIWSSTLPALSALDQISIFKGDTPSAVDNPQPTKSPLKLDLQPSQTESNESTPDSATPASSGITLKDLLLSGVFIALTFIAARNIPGLLEFTLLRRLQLQPGGSYAITTVLRYIIVAIGALAACGAIGISWASVQWLAAAVTLGIGFGLQEIFANFVAGLIILFERPIRLGDVVTVGDISGRVSQIKIRATTIKQFNNRELLVPNKEFITGQLVNWSLCDSLLRFELNVGIAYGSDTRLAQSILKDIALQHPTVLKDPEPSVLFTAFGASSLDFQLRGFVSGYDCLVSTQSELHYLIDQAFREANIEIAFPQTDIHIRSLPANAQEILEQQQNND